MYFHVMWWQQKQLPDISEGAKVWSWQTMILLINMIMDRAPEFNRHSNLVPAPICAILNWPTATTAGMAVFLNDKVKCDSALFMPHPH